MKEFNEIREILANCKASNGSISEQEIKEIEERLTRIEAEPRKNVIVYQIHETPDEKTKNVLPAATLHDEMKNKIFQNLHKNLTLEQLENLETFAKNTLKNKQYVEAV